MSTTKPGARRRLVLILILLVAALVGGWQYLRPRHAGAQTLAASGTVEAQVVNLAPELGGRVVEVFADEGQPVTAGQVLVRIDDAALQAQLLQARAAQRAAQANYDLLNAGSTAEQMRQAQAALDGAQARLDSAKAGPRSEQVTQAKANLSIANARLAALERGGRPEQVTQAEASRAVAQSRLDQLLAGATEQDIALAKLAVDQAKNALWAAQASRDGICGNKRNPEYLCDAADAQTAAAETAVQQAETRLAQLVAGATTETISQAKDAVRAAEAQLELAKRPASAEDVEQAKDAVRLAEAQLALVRQPLTSYDVAALTAQVEAAQAQLDAFKAGARVQQLEAAQAQVDLAGAQVQAIEVQLDKLTIKSPIDGVILTRSIEPGEITSPGATLMVVGKLDTLEITVYLPEEKFPLVTPGEQARVQVDAYPNRVFTATVLRIADQAEFTPRSVQTVEGRKDTVFAVRLGISNPDLALKPGLPADVTFGQP